MIKNRRLEAIGFRKKRQVEREYLEAKAKGMPLPEIQDPIIKKLGLQSNRSTSLPVNEWERLDRCPPSKLRANFPPSLIEKDIFGLNEIQRRTQKQEQEMQRKQAERDKERMILRQSLAKTHERWADLEAKCGIVKVREDIIEKSTDSLRSSTFGFSRAHVVSPRTQALSRPKRSMSPTNPYIHYDFRGMVGADFKTVVDFFKPSSPQTTSKSCNSSLPIQKPSPPKQTDEKQIRDDLNSIERVERICRNSTKRTGYSKAELLQFINKNN
mmetsp:Transcript_5982/g.10581  ORF Transcript_5982/g.10581 Transcript_5982/m.10581 type:complete len:270 (-) Transcript_5982:200-1009(-)